MESVHVLAVANVYYHQQLRSILFLPCSLCICCLSTFDDGHWMSVVVLIGIPAAFRDAERLVLWWKFDFVFVFSLKGVRTIYLWELAS